jgi:hypothetical protein
MKPTLPWGFQIRGRASSSPSAVSKPLHLQCESKKLMRKGARHNGLDQPMLWDGLERQIEMAAKPVKQNRRRNDPYEPFGFD